MNCSAAPATQTPPAAAPAAGAQCTIALKKQTSQAACVEGTSFGCTGAKQAMWTTDGCRGSFVVDGATVVCDVNGPGRHYCGPVTCVPTITELQKKILLNKEVIAINQDGTREEIVGGGKMRLVEHERGREKTRERENGLRPSISVLEHCIVL